MSSEELSSTQLIPIYFTTVIICIFYLSNIASIVYLRKSAFSSLIYETSIVTCIAYTIAAAFICSIAVGVGSVCFSYLWTIYTTAIMMGSNYLVKCLRIIIQTEWNYHFNVETLKTGESNSSNLSGSSSGSTENLLTFLNVSRLNSFVLRGIPLLRRRNSLILFVSSTLVGLLIPLTINLTFSEYRDDLFGQCTVRQHGETIIIASIVVFYVIIFITALVFVLRRRKSSKNMFVANHLKYLALAWVIGIAIIVLLNILYYAFVDEDYVYSYIIVVMGFNLLFIITFVAEIVMPQVHHFRLKRKMREYERLYDEISSIETMMRATFSRSISVNLDELESESGGVTVRRKRKERIKNVRNMYEYLKTFILQYQRFQDDFRHDGIDTEILVKRLLYINVIRRRRLEYKSEDKITILPGHILELWHLFFSGEKRRPSFNNKVDIPEEFMNEKIRRYFENIENRTKEQYVDYFLEHCEWRELYDENNPIGALPEELVKIIFKMENNFDIGPEDLELCSSFLLNLYDESVELLNSIVLPLFKQSEYFVILIKAMKRNN